MPSLLVKLRRLNIIKSSLIARTEDRAIAIHDVDKGSLDRGTPSPNHSDQVIDGAHKANSTTSIHPVTDASGTSAYTQTKGGRLLVNDGTTNRVIVGALADGTFGMKVSKPTFDVTTTSDNNLIFNSSQNVFKIVSSGTSTINGSSATAGSAIVNTVAHNLGYVPAFLAYFSAGGTYYQLPNSTGFGASGGVMTLTNWIFASTDSTNIYLTLIPSNSGNVGTFPIKYYLLQETAS